MSRSAWGVCCMALIIALGAIVAGASGEENWPRFRGESGLGYYAGALPTEWNAGDVAWRVELGGSGHSSPCIWGERVFVTAAVKNASPSSTPPAS